MLVHVDVASDEDGDALVHRRVLANLMRDALRDCQRSSQVTHPEVITGHQRSSQVTHPEVITGHQRSSQVTHPEVITGHQRSSQVTHPEVITGHQRSSEVTHPKEDGEAAVNDEDSLAVKVRAWNVSLRN